MGGADYAKYAPEHSFINVADFDSAEQLAQYLIYLDKNDSEYQTYFRVSLRSSRFQFFPSVILIKTNFRVLSIMEMWDRGQSNILVSLKVS